MATVDEARIGEAENSLRDMLALNSLSGKSFLDIGSGSGLFSLAARRLGARVHSFDFDPQSVACTRELQQRYFPDDDLWTIAEGSVLDKAYVGSLGRFDVVYSWGVLHHTGDLFSALENAAIPLESGSRLFIAIYNDQGFKSRFWRGVKRVYCSGIVGRQLVKLTFVPCFALQAITIGIIRHRNPLGYFSHYKQRRGMSVYYDWIDWLGGYPFEVAKPEEVFHFYRERGCSLTNLTTTNRLGCNEFVFQKTKDRPVDLAIKG